MNRLAVLNVVGLIEDYLGVHTPNISKYLSSHSRSTLEPPFPAVTSTVQSTILTGLEPCEHGVVANGWHERSTHETHFWRQSNDLVQAEKVWDTLKKIDSTATVANLFWWFNMYSTVDIAVTPRPIYCANGRKIPDIWTTPTSLRDSLQDKLGRFPMFHFWGPAANIKSSQWIAKAAIEIESSLEPTLSLVYLPHLDYPLQRVGPNHDSIPSELQAIDRVVGELIDFYQSKGVGVCILSEYGIEQVQGAIAINRVLRDNGLLSIREECSREYLDAANSEAFAVPDHQVAHVYIRNASDIDRVKTFLESVEGIDEVLKSKDTTSIHHERSGDLIAISSHDKWFSHDWWNEDSKAPDYQRTVDIHKKPGYDPRELFLARGWKGSKIRIAYKVLMRKLGSNTLLDVISGDASMVKGSHGRTPNMGAPSPIIIAPSHAKKMPQSLPAAAVKDLMIEWIIS